MDTRPAAHVEIEVEQAQAETSRRDGESRPAEARAARREVSRDFARGFLVALMALALQVGCEHTELGERIQANAYELLQLRLATPGLSEPLPVAVVDISELKPVQVNSEGWQHWVTPRPQLLELIEAIAKPGQVKGIGVDIDFAPDEPGYMWDDDPDFFQQCLDISETTGVPIFLGVRRSQDLEPAVWLGGPEYKALAATGSVRLLDGRRLPKWTKRDEDAETGRSLSAALASTLPRSGTRPPHWIGWAIKEVSETRLAGHNITFGEFLVDYGLLDLIRNKTLKTINPAVIADQFQWVLKNKVVLLGDALIGESDTSGVPGQKAPVPGVYLHACAVYTLTNPLYEMTWWGRTVVDLTLSMVLVGMVAAIKLGARSIKLDVSLLQGVLTLLIILVAVVVGVAFVRRTRIVWDDFLLAIGALYLHPSIDKWLNLVKNKILPSVKKFFMT